MPFYTHDNVPDSPINNFATFNPLDPRTGTKLSEGNLKITEPSSSVHGYSTSTLSINTPVYFECYCPNNAGPYNALVVEVIKDSSNYMALYFNNYSNGTHWKKVSGVQTIVVSAPTPYIYSGDVIGVFFEPVSGNGWYHINGTWQHGLDPTTSPLFTLLANQKDWFVEFGPNTNSQYANFGQDPTFGGSKSPTTTYPDANGIGQFHYQPPAGALALCTANIPEGPIKLSQDQTPSDNFKAVTYTGNGGTNSITGLGFQPDLVWAKNRTTTGANHRLFDSVRGPASNLYSSLTNAAANDPTGLTSFDSDGFSIGATSVNDNNANFVAWCWKAAGSPADGGSSVAGSARIINEDGTQADTTCAALASAAGASITPSKVSANRQNGFSIVSYTGDNSDSTIPHGLNAQPEMIIVKQTNGSGQWYTWHSSLASGVNLRLNEAVSTFGTGSAGNIGKNVNSSTFGFNRGSSSYSGPNGTQDYICYCWHSVEGYSKFGSYEGSSALPFVYTGFRVSFLLLKNVDTNASWVIHDSARDPYNEVEGVLNADASTEEKTYSTTGVDFLSNGFKFRGGSSWYGNSSSTTQKVIFMAFAEQPFSGPSNAR